MKIHATSLERLRQARISGAGLAQILEHVALGLDMCGAGATDLQLDWQKPGEPVEHGELIPVVTLSLRPALVIEESD